MKRKQTIDSPIRRKLYEAMAEFGIPANLIRVTLTNTKSSGKVGKNVSEPFEIKHLDEDTYEKKCS